MDDWIEIANNILANGNVAQLLILFKIDEVRKALVLKHNSGVHMAGYADLMDLYRLMTEKQN